MALKQEQPGTVATGGRRATLSFSSRTAPLLQVATLSPRLQTILKESTELDQKIYEEAVRRYASGRDVRC